MTLEKDKEDQSKYNLSYLKLFILDMKWENRDINVVEWANTPRFSKLADILTPLRFLKLFFDDALVDMTVGYTKLYSHRKKTYISFEITNEKTCLFVSMLLLNGCNKLPDRKFIGRRPQYFCVRKV